MNFAEEKAVKADRFTNKMRSWTNRQLKKLGSQKKPEEGNLRSNINMCLNLLNTEIDTAEPPEVLEKETGNTMTTRET